MNKSHTDLSNSLIRSMCRTANEVLDYDYTRRFYSGKDKSTVLQDHRNKVANSLGVLLSDMEIYMQRLDITETVRERADKRTKKLNSRKK